MFCIFAKAIVITTVALVSMTVPAYAYLDPGTGSMVTTAILGFIAAILFTVRKYFYKVARVFRGRSGKADATNNADE